MTTLTITLLALMAIVLLIISADTRKDKDLAKALSDRLAVVETALDQKVELRDDTAQRISSLTAQVKGLVGRVAELERDLEERRARFAKMQAAKAKKRYAQEEGSK